MSIVGKFSNENFYTRWIKISEEAKQIDCTSIISSKYFITRSAIFTITKLKIISYNFCTDKIGNLSTTNFTRKIANSLITHNYPRPPYTQETRDVVVAFGSKSIYPQIWMDGMTRIWAWLLWHVRWLEVTVKLKKWLLT